MEQNMTNADKGFVSNEAERAFGIMEKKAKRINLITGVGGFVAGIAIGLSFILPQLGVSAGEATFVRYVFIFLFGCFLGGGVVSGRFTTVIADALRNKIAVHRVKE